MNFRTVTSSTVALIKMPGAAISYIFKICQQEHTIHVECAALVVRKYERTLNPLLKFQQRVLLQLLECSAWHHTLKVYFSEN